MRHFAIFVWGVVLCTFSLLKGLRYIQRRQSDPLIDKLIARNAARPVDGMEKIDWRKTTKAGETVWQETLRGQRRVRKSAFPANIVTISDRIVK